MDIISARVIIKTTKEEDLKYFQLLWNNREVMKWVGYPEGLNVTIDKLKKWLEKINKSSMRKSFVVFQADNSFCGELFYEIDKKHQRAGLDIKFLPEAQGKGLGTESLKLLIKYIFENEIDVKYVWTEPSPKNNHARKVYEHCGLKEKSRPLDLEHGLSYWELSKNDWERLK